MSELQKGLWTVILKESKMERQMGQRMEFLMACKKVRLLVLMMEYMLG